VKKGKGPAGEHAIDRWTKTGILLQEVDGSQQADFLEDLEPFHAETSRLSMLSEDLAED